MVFLHFLVNCLSVYTTDPLVFKGETMEWVNSRDDFGIALKTTYDSTDKSREKAIFDHTVSQIMECFWWGLHVFRHSREGR